MARIARTQCTQSVSITVTHTSAGTHQHTRAHSHTHTAATKTTHKRGHDKLWETQQPTPQAAGRALVFPSPLSDRLFACPALAR